MFPYFVFIHSQMNASQNQGELSLHDNTHQGWTGAAQAICGDQAGQRTLARSAQLCWEHWCVEGLPQDVVHTAVGPVVVSGRDLQQVCTEKSLMIRTSKPSNQIGTLRN